MTHAMDDVVIPNPRVMIKDLDGEAVLLDLDTETYFGLNETAARFWALISGGLPLGKAVQAMAEEYDASSEVLGRDLEDLLAELDRLGLIRFDRA